MSATKIRITMENNSDARRADVLASLRGVEARHNGGKVVIAMVPDAQLDAAKAILDESHAVKAYEWE